MKNERKREIRRKAEFFREKCKVSRYGIIDIFKECERCEYKLIRYPIGTEATLGFVKKKDKDIIIFTNTSVRLSREIFTLAHEIGHILLHIEQSKTFLDDTASILNTNTDDKEEEANYFAVCLLMPEEEISKFLDLEIDDFNKNGLNSMDIARIMSEFNVSFEMTLNRLESLNKISHLDRINLDIERNKRSVGNLLKSVGGNSKLNEVSMIRSIPHEYIDYVIYNYNHNAIPKETLERALVYYNLTYEDISDKIKIIEDTEDEEDIDDLIGGLSD